MTTFDEGRREAMAEALASAERDRTPIPPLTDAHPDLTVEDAYAIQSLNIERRVAEGRLVRGRKVGKIRSPCHDCPIY